MSVELFVPCLVDQAAPRTALATAKVLRRAGLDVHFDRRQTCCGQALFNSGHRREAVQLAERFVYLFEDAEAVIAPSGSCVAMVTHHYGDLDLHPTIRKGWEALRTRVFELTSYLVDQLHIDDLGSHFPHSVVYHPSCHITRNLGIHEQPLKLLRNVHDLKLLGEELSVECCGFGGAFSVKYPELSQTIAESRLNQLAATGAEYITGCDDSCLQHLSHNLHRLGKASKVVHIAEILASEDGLAK